MGFESTRHPENRDIDTLTDGYIDWVLNWLDHQNWKLLNSIKILKEGTIDLFQHPDQAEEIIKIARSLDKSQPDLTLLKAQLLYCMRNEMICNLQDFFVRRTGLIYFDIYQVEKWKEEIATECASLLGWDNVKISAELKDLGDLMESQRNFGKQ